MALTVAKTRPGLKNLFVSFSRETRGFFVDLPALLDSNFSLDIILAYTFLRIEQGQNLALYCGARKLHKTESSLTWQALNLQHMTRDAYKEFFERIFDFPLDTTACAYIAKAEKVRNRVMHGKTVSMKDKREAISYALHYAERINNFIGTEKGMGFKPFAPSLRGFCGRLPSLDKKTTRWILKGMQFTIC